MQVEDVASAQYPAGHVACEYVIHSDPTSTLYVPRVSHKQSVKPSFKIYAEVAVQVNVSCKPRASLFGGVVPSYLMFLTVM
tara:strand:+ start:635 stop:877 length:243 start_codon:yes stop_codon:yes gene_type:complete